MKYLDAMKGDQPRAGYVYSCDPKTFYETAPIIGSRNPGPWIHEASYDVTEKVWVPAARPE